MNYSETCNLWKYVRRIFTFVRIVPTIILTRDSKGFDRGFETGEAIRGMVAIYLKLNLNAEDNLAIAA